MARLLAAILFALAVTIPARATLVVVVPSAEGLVVAADSRESILGTECDGLFKIVAPRQPSRTVVVVTGDAVFVSPPRGGAAGHGQTAGLCAYLESAPRLLDISAVVTQYLEQDVPAFDRLDLDDLAATCVAAVRRFRQSHADTLASYKGRDLFSVVIAHYDPKSRVSMLLNFVVGIDAATDEIRSDRFDRITIGPQDRRGVWAFGEADYLVKNVYRGAGRKYLSDSTRSFILEDRPVRQAPPNQSVAVAIDVIRAANRTAETVPAPSGIGGPIHVVLLGSKRRPQEISRPSVPGP